MCRSAEVTDASTTTRCRSCSATIPATGEIAEIAEEAEEADGVSPSDSGQPGSWSPSDC